MKLRLIYMVLIAGLALGNQPSAAQTPDTTVRNCTKNTIATGDFEKKRYAIKGNWTLTETCGEIEIQFSDTFKTKGGPDLKVFLSKTPIAGLTSQSAIQESIKLSVLKTAKGGQNYSLPTTVNLSDYKSVIIHCEAFSVLWGGFDLP